MPISDVVNIAISVSGAGPTAAGFGEPLIAAYHTQYTDRVREYANLQAVAVDFPVTAPAYLAAQSVFSQNPCPAAVKIGRRALPFTQTLHITCTSSSPSDTYKFQMRSPGGSWATITTPSTGTPATDATTLAALINAASLTAVTSSGTNQPAVTLTGTATEGVSLLIKIVLGGAVGTATFNWSANGGISWTNGVMTASTVVLTGTGLTADFAAGTYTANNVYSAQTALGFASASAGVITVTQYQGGLVDLMPDYVHCTLADVTADPGLATDLTAILAADGNWYGLLLDSQSPAEILAGAAWVQGQSWYEFVCNCSDTAIATSSTSDVASTLKNDAYSRTALLFAQTQLLCYSGAGWMGRMFPTTAGSENWAFKTIAGVPADALTAGQVHSVEGKNASVYTTLAGLNLTQFGKVASGEWLDITRGTDALTNTLQIGVLAMQANTLKVPFTDAGIDMYRAVISSTLKTFINIGFLSDAPPPFISLPTAAQVDATDKANRNLPLVSFTAKLAGAINSTSISGVLTT